MTALLIRLFVKNPDNTTDARVRLAYGQLAGAVGIAMNILLFCIKLIAGILSGSISITADAANNLTDASSAIVSLIGFKMSAKPADHEHPYGHARYEYLAGLSVTALILLIGFELLKSGIDKLIRPTEIEFHLLTVIILVVSILLKIWMARFNTKIGKTIYSQTLAATATDSRNDVISTAAVLAVILISRFFSVNLDGIIATAVALFILYSGIRLIKETVSPLLGSAPNPETVKAIEQKILAYPRVLGMHDLIIHDYGPGRQFASVHVEMAAEDDVLESHDIIDNIERDFLSEGLHLIVHFDPVVTADETVGELRTWLAAEVKTIRPSLSVHDLRTVPGPTHTNVIFDLVIPHEFAKEETAIKQEIRAAVANRYPNHHCVITVDNEFSVTPHK